MEGTAVLFRCALCGVESPERSCFIFLNRHGRSPKNIRCVQCAQARRRSTLIQNLATVLIILAGPFMYMGMGFWSDDIKIPLYVEFVLGCLAYPVALVAHELAHAVMGHLLGLELGGINFGFGRVIWKFQVHGLPVQLRAWPLSGRVYLGAQSLRFLRPRLWLTVLMGPLINLVLAGIAAAWWHPLAAVLGAPVVSTWILVNGVVAFFNLLPFSGTDPGGHQYRSDGLALFKIPWTNTSELEVLRFSAWLNRALCCFEAEDFAGALAWLEKAQQRVSGNVHVTLALAACKMMLGEYASGRALLQPLLDPGNLEPAVRAAVCNNMAYGLIMSDVDGQADLERLAWSDRLSSEAITLFPCVLDFRTVRALVLAVTQRPEEALQLLEYRHYETSTGVRRGMRHAVRAFALRKLGRSEEADEAAALAVQGCPALRAEMRLLGLSVQGQAPEPALAGHLRGLRTSLVADVRRTAEALIEPEPVVDSYSGLARIAGAILTLFGVGLFALTVLIVIRQWGFYDHLNREVLIAVFVMWAAAAVFLTLGYRLVLNRPNRYGSLLHPNVWLALSVGLVAVTLLMVRAYFLSRGPKAPSAFLFTAPLLIAVWCWMAGMAARRSRA